VPTLAHKIRLDPTPDQIQYFKQAAGTAHLVWNWVLAEWHRQYATGQKPQATTLKKQFNALKYEQFAWLKGIHRDAHSQPFADLADAWKRFCTGQNDRSILACRRLRGRKKPVRKMMHRLYSSKMVCMAIFECI